MNTFLRALIITAAGATGAGCALSIMHAAHRSVATWNEFGTLGGLSLIVIIALPAMFIAAGFCDLVEESRQ